MFIFADKFIAVIGQIVKLRYGVRTAYPFDSCHTRFNSAELEYSGKSILVFEILIRTAHNIFAVYKEVEEIAVSYRLELNGERFGIIQTAQIIYLIGNVYRHNAVIGMQLLPIGIARHIEILDFCVSRISRRTSVNEEREPTCRRIALNRMTHSVHSVPIFCRISRERNRSVILLARLHIELPERYTAIVYINYLLVVVNVIFALFVRNTQIRTVTVYSVKYVSYYSYRERSFRRLCGISFV